MRKIEKKKFEIEEQGTDKVFQYIGLLSIDGKKYVYDLKTLEVVGIKDEELCQAAREFLTAQKSKN